MLTLSKGEDEEEELDEEEKDEDEEELEETITMAIRAPKRGDLEQILASNLAAAIFSKPLDKIRIILEALLLLPKEDQLAVTVNDDELQYAKELYEVAVSLSNLVETPPPYPNERGRFACIPWSFSINNAWKYLQHFVSGTFDLSSVVGEGDWNALMERLSKGEEDAKKDYLNALAAWLSSPHASLGSCKMLESEFCIRVMPYASELLRKIFSRYITKETWEQTLSLIGGKAKGVVASI